MNNTLLDQLTNNILVQSKDLFILGLDPGNTTGWVIFHNGTVVDSGQINTNIDSLNKLFSLFIQYLQLTEYSRIPRNMNKVSPYILCEDYRIYEHKALTHANSKVPTIRFIGNIEVFAWTYSIPIIWQMAATGKSYFSDDVLLELGLYKKSNRHRNDAVRHVLHYLCFNRK